MSLTTPFSKSYTSGKILKVEAPAIVNSGTDRYTFTKWEDNSTNPIRTYTVGSTATLTATYTKVIKYNLTVQATTGGSTNPVAGVYSYFAGDSASVTATPTAGYALSDWKVDGVNQGNSNPTFSITMNASHTIVPVFVSTTITMTIAASTGGTVSPVGTFAFNIGQTYTFVATSNSGYHFHWWELPAGTNISSNNPLQLTITGAMNNQTLTAIFDVTPPTPVTFTIATSGSGTTTPAAGQQTVNIPADQTSIDVTFKATPSAGYVFDHWTIFGSNYTASTVTIAVTQAMAGQTVTAYFIQQTFTVTITSTPVTGVTITVTEMN